MASRKIVKTDLLKLLPDYEATALPLELIELTEALLSQIKMQFMITSEQPARTFVCAHIACERLANKLNLPERNTSKSPIPPARYRSLLKRLQNDASFRQIHASGQSKFDSSRSVARDLVKEICSKMVSVPIAPVLDVLDRVLPDNASSELRSLVAATWLVCHQYKEKLKAVSATAMTALTKELCITKQEIEREVTRIIKLSDGNDWFDAFDVVTFKNVQEVPKRRERISQIRMAATSIDYESPKFKRDYETWERNFLIKAQGKLDS